MLFPKIYILRWQEVSEIEAQIVTARPLIDRSSRQKETKGQSGLQLIWQGSDISTSQSKISPATQTRVYTHARACTYTQMLASTYSWTNVKWVIATATINLSCWPLCCFSCLISKFLYIYPFSNTAIDTLFLKYENRFSYFPANN